MFAGAGYLLIGLFDSEPQQNQRTARQQTDSKSSTLETKAKSSKETESAFKSRLNRKTAEPSVWNQGFQFESLNSKREPREALEIQQNISELSKLFEFGNNKEFLSKARKLIDENPEVPEYRAILADFHVKAGQFDQAIPVFEGLVEVMPENSFARNALAAIYSMQGSPEKSNSVYREAAEQNPSNMESMMGYITTSAALGKQEEVHQFVRRHYEADPTNPTLAIVMADIHASEQQPELRDQALRKAYEANPTNSALNRVFMFEAFSAGNHNQVIEYGQVALENDSNPESAQQTLSILLESANELGDQQLAQKLEEQMKALQEEI